MPNRILVGSLVLLFSGAALVWYLHQKEYAYYFMQKKGTIVDIHRKQAGENSEIRKEWVTLTNDQGFVVECGVRAPSDSGHRRAAFIVLGGSTTGKHAIDYAVESDDLLIAAVAYRHPQRTSYTATEFLAEVPEIRRSLIEMVPAVMLVMDYLHGRPDVDTNRIVLVGYSFGGPLVPVVIAHDRRPAAAVIIFGGGNLRTLISHNVRRYRGVLVSELVGLLGGLLLRPVEPLRYAAAISPTPLIMINGKEDELIPQENVEELYAAVREPKVIRWLDARHVRPDNVELTRTIIGVLREELADLKLLR